MSPCRGRQAPYTVGVGLPDAQRSLPSSPWPGSSGPLSRSPSAVSARGDERQRPPSHPVAPRAGATLAAGSTAELDWAPLPRLAELRAESRSGRRSSASTAARPTRCGSRPTWTRTSAASAGRSPPLPRRTPASSCASATSGGRSPSSCRSASRSSPRRPARRRFTARQRGAGRAASRPFRGQDGVVAWVEGSRRGGALRQVVAAERAPPAGAAQPAGDARRTRRARDGSGPPADSPTGPRQRGRRTARQPWLAARQARRDPGSAFRHPPPDPAAERIGRGAPRTPRRSRAAHAGPGPIQPSFIALLCRRSSRMTVSIAVRGLALPVVFAAALGATISLFPVNAQEAPQEPAPTVTETIQVTATRTPGGRRDRPRLGHRDQRRGARRPRRHRPARRRSPSPAGISVAPGGDNGPAGSVPEIWGLREFDAFLLVVDGVPWGGAFNPALPTLDLVNVERIEILRGAAPVMYGATSFVGVIHVIHRAAGAPGRAASVWGGSYGSGGGSFSSPLPRLGPLQAVAHRRRRAPGLQGRPHRLRPRPPALPLHPERRRRQLPLRPRRLDRRPGPGEPARPPGARPLAAQSARRQLQPAATPSWTRTGSISSPAMTAPWPAAPGPPPWR